MLLLWLLVAVILATVVALMLVVSSQGEAADAIRTAQTALNDVETDQLNEETGLRGFQASGNSSFLDPYEAARATLAGDFIKLEQAFELPTIREHSAGARRTPLLEQINAEWERTIAGPIVSGRLGRTDPYALVQGKILDDRFHSVVNAMHQSLELAARDDERTVQRNILAVGAIGVSIALLVAIALATLIRRTAALERRIEQEQQIQGLADEFPQLVWTADRSGALTWVNRAFSEATGIPEGSLPDRAIWSDLLHPDDLERLAPIWSDSFARGIPVKEEYRFKGRSERHEAYRWMFSVTTPVVNKNGSIERWIGSAIDIHERKTAEAALERERTLLAEAMPQIVWQADAAGSATFFNSQCYAYTGLTRDQALGDGWTASIHPDDLDSTMRAWQAALESESSYETEYRIREGSTGTYRWFLGRGNPVRAETGEIERWIGTCTDIDAQKRLEAAVRESADSFERLADIVPALIWMSDASGIPQYLNRRWLEYTGLAAPPSTVEAMWSLVHPDDRRRASEAWNRSARTGDEFETDYRLRRFDGAYRWFLVRGRAARTNAGEIFRWFGMCTDIDEQREAHDSLLGELEREHRVSDSFQRAALPKELPQLENISIHAVYRAAATEAFVGGDWYDAFTLTDGRIAISVGDVMGKGLEAAVTMNAVRQCIRGTARVVQYPTTVLDAVDDVIRDDAPNAMVTAFLGILDPRTMTLTYASAGHPPPVVRNFDGSVHELEADGLPIGYRRFRVRYQPAQTADLSQAELVVLYTDGLTEAHRDAMDGERRLVEAIAGNDVVHARDPAEALAAALLGSGTPDDVAILALRIYARVPASSFREVPAVPSSRWSESSNRLT